MQKDELKHTHLLEGCGECGRVNVRVSREAQRHSLLVGIAVRHHRDLRVLLHVGVVQCLGDLFGDTLNGTRAGEVENAQDVLGVTDLRASHLGNKEKEKITIQTPTSNQ